MKKNSIFRPSIVALAFVGLAGVTSANADTLIFDRGLPTANLNNAAGPSRSNVAWGDGGTTESMGDNFTIDNASVINDIRVWVVSNTVNAPSANAYQLWFGQDTGTSTAVSSLAFSTSVISTTYSDGSSYQGSSGNFINIYQVDFGGLGLSVAGGTYAFGVSGAADVGYVPPLTTPFLSASNETLSGSTQTGDDGIVYGFTATGAMDTGNGYPWNSIGGWDKTSDINVQVFGNVPEPASLALLGLGLAGLGFARRRTQKAA